MIRPRQIAVTHDLSRTLAIRDPRKRDRIVSAVGQARQSIPLKASRAAVVSGHSEGQESRIRSGERMSPTSHAAVAVYEAARAEACPLEAAGYNSAYIEVALRSVAVWPVLEKLTTQELRQELKWEIIKRETPANAACNELENAFLGEDRLQPEAMIAAHTQQAAASTRIVALGQILLDRKD